jgi:hypothetical protein
MPPSSTLDVGVDVHKAAMAVASVAQEHGAAVTSRGTIGTRQGALDPRLRHLQATATHLVFRSDAGPCGSWRSRELTTKDDDCGGGAVADAPKGW